MQRVIVTVKRKDAAVERDLEVPSELDAKHLAELIARALRWGNDAAGQPLQFRIEAQPQGRALQPTESLADAGVWDGSWLVLSPLSASRSPIEVVPDAQVPSVGVIGSAPLATAATAATAATVIQPVDEEPGTAVSGWRSLGIDLPAAPAPASALEEKPSKVFSWKQLDD